MVRSAPSQSFPRRSNRLTISIALLSAIAASWALAGVAAAHSGWVDGYGCHASADKKNYHCHQGEFVGRTFKSKEDFLRRIREGKAEQLSPRGNADQPSPPEIKIAD
jgi:hypothetical protein